MPRFTLFLSLALLLGCQGCSQQPATADAPPAEPQSVREAAEQAGRAAAPDPASSQEQGAGRKQTALRQRLESVLIERMPHAVQKPDFCGEACLAMELARRGAGGDQDFVFDQAGLDPALGRGCCTGELVQAARKLGFDVGPAWYTVEAEQAGEQLEAHFAVLHSDLARGIPAVVCMHYDSRPESSEHFRLVVGYDAKSDEVIYHEPAEQNGAYRRMARSTFLALWPLKYQADRWTVIYLRLAGKRLISGKASSASTSADYAQHVMRLRERLPSEEFHVVVRPPFVVIGNEVQEQVEKRAAGTVKWAVDRLKADFFDKDPAEIIDIWLFRDKASYEKHVPVLFGEPPGTPFGYYSPRHKALIMNISTGGGTLVHEIVHPFVAADFPECPSWLNEGLGSLYEQCGDRRGRIWGYTNWRLEGLQQAIRAGQVPSFKTLCSTTRNQFYSEDPGTNYAQARYLCYYLQEHNLLRKYYRRFRSNWRDDPSGYTILADILGETDMAAFQDRWEKFVLGLRFP